MIDIVTLFLHSFWSVLGQMAPYLIFGYLIAGVLSVFVTTETVKKHLGGSKFASTLKAALFGMPLPLCSCSVLPVTASLRKSGAGRGAIASFLISTPTTGVDSIMAAWALMGPVFAIYRAIMSVLLGISTGVLVNLFGKNGVEVTKDMVIEEHSDNESGGCCGSNIELEKSSKLTSALKYGFITIPRDLGKPLFVGIIIASIISALIEANFIDQFLGDGIGTMLIMLVLGIPLYVCATASIPLALGFMALGASPGAAFVFLIAGPATNAATITVLWKMIGKRSTIIMLSCMFFGALFGGMLLDATWSDLGVGSIAADMHPEHSATWFYSLSAIVLVLIQLWSMFGNSIVARLTGVENSQSCCNSTRADVVKTSCCSSSAKREVSCCGSDIKNEQGDMSQKNDSSSSSCCFPK